METHFIRETLDSGHSYGGGRMYTFMTVCGRRMSQHPVLGTKGTSNAVQVTCKECLKHPKVKEWVAWEMANQMKGKIKNRVWPYYTSNGWGAPVEKGY